MRCLLLVGAALSLSAAVEAKPRLAVLELQRPAAMAASQARYLTDVVRGAALATLAGRVLVLTRENLVAHLPPGVELAACEGDCEVETGRNVGADYVVSGAVMPAGDGLKLMLKLHETRGGALLATRRAAAPAARLEAALEEATAALLAEVRPETVIPRAAPNDGWRLDWEDRAGGDFPKGYGGMQVYEALTGKVLGAPAEGTWGFRLPWTLPESFELTFQVAGDTRNQRARCLSVVLEGDRPVPIHVCPHPDDTWVLGFGDPGREGRARAAHDHLMPVRVRREPGVIKLLLDDRLVISRAAPPTPTPTARVRVRTGPPVRAGEVVGQVFEHIALRPLPR